MAPLWFLYEATLPGTSGVHPWPRPRPSAGTPPNTSRPNRTWPRSWRPHSRMMIPPSWPRRWVTSLAPKACPSWPAIRAWGERSLTDLAHEHVAVDVLDGEAADVAVPAVRLDGVRAHALGHLAGVKPGHSGLFRACAASAPQAAVAARWPWPPPPRPAAHNRRAQPTLGRAIDSESSMSLA